MEAVADMMMNLATGTEQGLVGTRIRGDQVPASNPRPSNLGVGGGGSRIAKTGNVHRNDGAKCLGGVWLLATKIEVGTA